MPRRREGGLVEDPDARVRFFRPADRDRLLELKCRSFPGCTRERERLRWDWQFAANPARSLGLPEALVLELQHVVQGYYALVPYRVHAAGRTLAGACGVDLCIAPEARGRGLAHGLVAPHWEEGLCDFAFASGVNRASQHLFAAHGATLLGGRQDPMAFVLPLEEPAPQPGVVPLPVETLESCGPEEDAFWRRWSEERRLCLVRDSAYLNWRYRDTPFQPCVLLRACDSRGASRGLAVVQADPGNARMYLHELLALRGDAAALHGLLRAARRVAQEAGAEALFHATRSQDQHAVLAAEGFRGHPGDVPTFMGRLHAKGVPPGIRVQDWDASLGDGDTLFVVGDPPSRELREDE